MNSVTSLAVEITTFAMLLTAAGTCAFAQDGHSNVSNDGYKVVRSWNVSTQDANPANCTEQVNAVRDSPVSFNVPASWGFAYVVVCDPDAWFRLKLMPRYKRVNTNTGMTDFNNFVVYLNGYKRSAGELRDTTAHEIGHIICKCKDEDTANENKSKVLDAGEIAKN